MLFLWDVNYDWPSMCTDVMSKIEGPFKPISKKGLNGTNEIFRLQ